MSTEPIYSLIDGLVHPVPPPENIEPGMKYPTHAGEVTLGGHRLRCYVLNTGERIFNAEDIQKLIGGTP